MLIKLIPPTPHPTILFALNLPPALPLPPAWAAPIARLALDDLEVSRTLHSLDRAADLPVLLAEVTFDLPAARVQCRFFDGALEEWPLVDERRRERLEGVLRDVEESARVAREEEERARAAEEVEREREREKARLKEQSRPSPPPSVKIKRPRMQRSRSLLMSLVASVEFLYFPICLSSSFPSPFLPSPPSPSSPSLAISLHPPPPLLSSRASRTPSHFSPSHPSAPPLPLRISRRLILYYLFDLVFFLIPDPSILPPPSLFSPACSHTCT